MILLSINVLLCLYYVVYSADVKLRIQRIGCVRSYWSSL